MQTPERLWREGSLMLPVALCTIVMLVCLWQPTPWRHRATASTIPTIPTVPTPQTMPLR